jgi:hypothetical protein
MHSIMHTPSCVHSSHGRVRLCVHTTSGITDRAHALRHTPSCVHSSHGRVRLCVHTTSGITDRAHALMHTPSCVHSSHGRVRLCVHTTSGITDRAHAHMQIAQTLTHLRACTSPVMSIAEWMRTQRAWAQPLDHTEASHDALTTPSSSEYKSSFGSSGS